MTHTLISTPWKNKKIPQFHRNAILFTSCLTHVKFCAPLTVWTEGKLISRCTNLMGYLRGTKRYVMQVAMWRSMGHSMSMDLTNIRWFSFDWGNEWHWQPGNDLTLTWLLFVLVQAIGTDKDYCTNLVVLCNVMWWGICGICLKMRDMFENEGL